MSHDAACAIILADKSFILEEFGVKIAILGTGRVGSTLGRRWAAAGHEIVFGSRDPSGEKARAVAGDAGSSATAASVPEAATGADVVVLATPWSQAETIMQSIGGAAGQIVVDCINPLNDTFSGLDLGFTESCAERIAAWAPQARVVKAFNSVSSATMADPVYDGQQATLFVCGDDDDARNTVIELGDQIDFESVDAGPLKNARYLEPLAMLYIHLAMNGWGSNCAFKILKR